MSWGSKTYHGHRARLRQKFKDAAFTWLHDYEILELLLTYSIPRVDVKPYAKDLLKKFGSIRGVLDAPRKDVAAVNGVGENVSVLIAFARELTECMLTEAASPQQALNQPEDVACFVAEHMGSNKGDEALLAVYLNSKNRPVGLDTIFEGCPDLQNISGKEVVKKALEFNARSVIFVHHGASLAAAEENLERPLAMGLRTVASAVDVVVHDYIILRGDSVLSAQQEGWFGSDGGRPIPRGGPRRS